MLPVIALVGRPNVGKSTLFNRLTKTRDALVANLPGLTRDRQYGQGQLGSRPYIVVDTGGIGHDEMGVEGALAAQARQAINEADILLFLVDARHGTTSADETIASQLRAMGKPCYLVANKTDGLDPDVAVAEAYQLGMGEPYPIAASHGRGVTQLIDMILEDLAEDQAEDIVIPAEEQGIKLAIVGRPNVGKSTLVNRMLGEDRVVVFDAPGTTRDSVFIPMAHQGQRYTLIDTAGVRRRAKVKETIEKFSVIKTLQAIEEAHVVILILDSRESIVDQDIHLLGSILKAGRALVIAFNKWDGMDMEAKQQAKADLARRLTFLDFAKTHFISALHGTGVGDLYRSVKAAYASATKELSTSALTDTLLKAVQAHQPPLVQGRRIKLRYAHAGGSNPPRIVIHGNQVEKVPASYERYLENTFRKAFKLSGTPVFLEFRQGDNPYAGRKNKLTPRQEQKRKRLQQFVQRKKK